jgi:polyisoprenoid-binding protein YceI
MQTERVSSPTQTVWTIDPAHTTVEFSVVKLFFIKVKGSFPEVSGSMVLDETDLGRSSVSATIRAASIDTGSRRRDAHLRSEEFLASDRCPDISFQSMKVERGQDRDTIRVTGSLVVRGTSGEVVLDVNDIDRSRAPSGEDFIYYSATTELDRLAFGITSMRGLIGRKVKIAINVQSCRTAR